MTTSATSRPRTIFARATPPGRGAVAIIRLSGPDTDATLAALTPGRALPEPRLASLRRIADPASGRAIDEALLLRFPGSDRPRRGSSPAARCCRAGWI